jgi:glucose/arabinose dehydrogenase/PKD repeat protein
MPPVSFIIAVSTALFAGALPPQDSPHFAGGFERVEIAGDWLRPCALVFADDGTAFVGEKTGRVLVRPANAPQATPFITLYDEVNSRDDRGLLGLALHPGFVADGGATSWVYLAYTVSPIFGENPIYNQDQKYSWSVLERYRALTNGQGEIVADLPSKEILLGERLPDGSAPTAIASLRESHSNGSLIFGDDGTLMISCGDGAYFVGLDTGGNDDPGFDTFTHPVTGLKGQIPKDQDSGAFRAQDLRSLAGKVLRIDPETGLGVASNPFHDGNPASLRSRIWCVGLRNAYRMAYLPGHGASDPAAGDPGLFIVSDVGSQQYEELNLVDAPGLDFRWPCFEGPNPQPLYSVYDRPTTNPFGFLDCDDASPGTPRAPLLAWSRFVPQNLFPYGTPSFDHDGAPTNGFGGSAAICGDFHLGGSGYPTVYDGRLFVADYGYDWIRTIAFDANFAVTRVDELAVGFDNVVDLERHPLTGEIWIVQLLDADGSPGHVYRLRHGTNASPVAQLDAVYTPGQSPLQVTLDASATVDPDHDVLEYTFTPGDGSAPVVTSAETLVHTYTTNGLYVASVEVRDTGGLVDVETVQVLVGITAPDVAITAPAQGLAVLTPTDVPFSGTGTDLDGLGPVDLVWDMTLVHNSHSHPNAGAGSGPTFLAQLGDHGVAGDLVYHEVALTGTTASGAATTVRRYVFDERQVFDRTGRAHFVAKLLTLTPPVPQGAGNTDFEVLRDRSIAPGAAPELAQFDTEHGGDQGDDDWIGFELAAPPGPYERFVGVDFTSGVVSAEGGWFESLVVEVRVGTPCPLQCGCEWQCVEELAIEPAYPTGANAPLGSDFTTYRMRFAPIAGDAVRVRGVPGGTIGFVSASEMRILTIAPNPIGAVRDVSGAGEIVARVLELVPPGSLGNGNPNIELLRDGTEPEPGSTSAHAQYSSLHGGDQGTLDWYGYSFELPHTFAAVHFREGLHFPDGGWFEDLVVETRLRESDPWVAVSGLQIAPPLRTPGPGTLSYESFDVTFDPVVARWIRIAGTPGGTSTYTTVSELAVLARAGEPAFAELERYGEGHAGNTLVLDTATAPILGSPFALQLTGCEPSTFGFIGYSGGALDVDLGFDQRLLIDPTVGFGLLVCNSDAQGLGITTLVLPSTPSLAGAPVYMQGLSIDPSSPLFDLSNGLLVRLSP